MSPSPRPRWRTIALTFAVGSLVGAVSAVQVAPGLTTTTLAGGSTDGASGSTTGVVGPGSTATGAGTGGSTTTTGGVPTPPPGIACAPGRNGGATDTGVTATTITLATTVVRSGIGASFLGDVQYAMEAVKNKVNREGGICGRRLVVRYVDDGWEAQRGAGYLRSFIADGVFAIPVGPSSEGLRVVIDSGDIRTKGIPVVGTDGMIINQYTDPWVWPVAVATASSARIMARDAYARGARTFSIVFDKNYRFGAEAAEAYNNEVRRLTGAEVDGYNSQHNCRRSFCGVLAGASSYSTDINQFEPGDYVAMFLEPTTALTWMSTPGAPTPAKVAKGIGAAQPLFTREFATSCQAACDQMWVWTGYKPPIEDYATDPAVRTFVSDLKKTKPDADEFNAFAEGGYVGMSLLVEGLREAGPFLTRATLRAALDKMRFRSGLTLQESLTWRPGNHFANATMQAFAIQYKGTFSGWRARVTATDPTPKRGIS